MTLLRHRGRLTVTRRCLGDHCPDLGRSQSKSRIGRRNFYLAPTARRHPRRPRDGTSWTIHSPRFAKCEKPPPKDVTDIRFGGSSRLPTDAEKEKRGQGPL